MKRFACALLILLACLLPLLGQAASVKKLRGYSKKAPNYQYVYLGEYPYDEKGKVQPVLWRILEVKNNRALLLTEYVIDTSQIIYGKASKQNTKQHSYRKIDNFAQSDLFKSLNKEYIEKLFGEDPVASALLPEPDGGKLFILNKEQITNTAYGFPKGEGGRAVARQAVGTPYAIKKRGLYKDAQNGKSTYWVSTLKDGSREMMRLVGYNGHISVGALTRVNVGLRLAVRLDLRKIKITGGSGTVKKPYVLAFKDTATKVPEQPKPQETAAPENPSEGMDAPASQGEPRAAGLWDRLAALLLPSARAEDGEAQENELLAPLETPAPTPAPAPKSTQAPPATALISLLGDCSIGDSFNSIKTANSYHSVIDQKGYAWPFSKVVKYLKADDLTVANLEVVITKKSKRKNIMYPLRAAPDHVKVLQQGSIEMVNTANNHCMDYMRDGYVDTIRYLDKAGIRNFGSVSYGKKDGFDKQETFTINGMKFGFLGFTYSLTNKDTKNIVARIQKLKKNQGCDVVIVSLHWGRETHMTPESWQVTMAKDLIDGGADMIYGHHPHVLQPITFYKNKPILFSVGNFTFGTMSEVDPHTGIFQATYQKIRGKAVLRKLQVIPCQTSGRGDYRPYELTAAKDRKATFKILSPGKKYSGCTNPPASFLKTGIVQFNEKGQMK